MTDDADTNQTSIPVSSLGAAGTASYESVKGDGSLTYTPSSTDIDGAILTWITGPWSDCSSECGPGGQSRVVSCYNNDTSVVVADSVCLGDTVLGPGGKPITEQDCLGPCITCTDRSSLFTSAGLAAPPATPVKSSSNYVCNVTESSYSCCDRNVENSIVTQVVAINKGFGSIPATAQGQIQHVSDFIANSTAEFSERLQATKDQLEGVQTLLDQASNLKMDKRINRALTVLKEVLTNRVSDLNSAISNSTLITSFLQSQLNVLADDVSLNQTTNSTITTGQSPKLAQCANATVGLFSSMSCAACAPSFVSENVNFPSNSSNLYSSINVTSSLCESVHKQCSPTIRSSRMYLEKALRVIRGIHSQLARAAAQLQPALAAVWGAVRFDWLPAVSKPSSSAVTPDITSLDCIKSSAAYKMGSATSVENFCTNFFESWNYQMTINSLLKDLKVGVKAMDSLQRCDKCFHMVMTKFTEIVSNQKGQIDVTLSLSPSALAESGCFGLSSSPAASSKNISSTTSALGNFFAISEGDIWVGSEKKTILEKSKRGISFILSTLKNNVKTNGTDASVPYVQILQYTPDGTDPSAIATVNWSLVGNATQNPPPSIWTNRSSSQVPVIATELNCTTHMACNPDGGDSPYWFCGTAKICDNPISCDDSEKALLSVHARCIKGLCVDDTTAVDGKCPEIAICPVTKIGQFDHTYFSKYRSIAPILPPSASLISSQGVQTANAVTQAQNFAKGVCDCAFSKKTDSSGTSILQIGDKCMYAQCLAYALANEQQTSCTSALLSKCQEYTSSCPNVVCDKTQALWNAPACELKTDKTQDGFALSSESVSATSTHMNTFVALVAALSIAIIV